MILDDVYKKQLARYNFAKKYCSGVVLDYTFTSILSYHGSKMLLNNGINEIFTYDISNNIIECSRRSLNDEGKMNYFIEKNNFIHENNSIDCILYSELNKNDNISTKEKIEYFHSILKNNGKLLISIVDKNNSSLIFDKKHDEMFFSKNEFLELLNAKFSKIELFSQKIITKKDINEKQFNSFFLLKTKFRFFLSLILLKFDKKSNFYNNYIKNVKKDNFKQDELNIEKFLPIPYNSKNKSLYLIAVCEKT